MHPLQEVEPVELPTRVRERSAHILRELVESRSVLPDEEERPQQSFDPATLDPKQPLPAITA